jgi:hypothetical protein
MMMIIFCSMLFEDELIQKKTKIRRILKIENLKPKKIINKQLSK